MPHFFSSLKAHVLLWRKTDVDKVQWKATVRLSLPCAITEGFVVRDN